MNHTKKTKRKRQGKKKANTKNAEKPEEEMSSFSDILEKIMRADPKEQVKNAPPHSEKK
jgi:hypothetical protein